MANKNNIDSMNTDLFKDYSTLPKLRYLFR